MQCNTPKAVSGPLFDRRPETKVKKKSMRKHSECTTTSPTSQVRDAIILHNTHYQTFMGYEGHR
jgi:hypothetical protein